MEDMTKRMHKGKSLMKFPDDYTIIDIETTGLDSRADYIIEIGAIKYRGGKEVARFSRLIKPDVYHVVYPERMKSGNYVFVEGHYVQYVGDFITELTGITNQMLLHGEEEREVIGDFAAFIEQDVLVGHNVHFDVNFLYDACLNIGMIMKNDFVDTLRLARRILPELPHYRLMDLAAFYQIDYSHAHRATQDCEITAHVLSGLHETCLKRYGSETYLLPKKYQQDYVRLKDIHSDAETHDVFHPFYQKVCVFTGTLERMKRREAMQKVADIGGINAQSITKKTDYLIVANNAYEEGSKSTKFKKAEAYAVDSGKPLIISEDKFYELLTLYKEGNRT